MDAMKTVELLRKYSKCKNCGSDALGNGAGSIEVDDNTFTRTCKCGWKVVHTVTERIVAPKCKTCNSKLCSGKKSYCNHPKAPRADKYWSTHIPSKEANPSPSWCPLRIELEGEVKIEC